MTLVGAAVGAKSGQTRAQAIAAFEQLTGRTIPIRRCYDSGVPTSLSTSAAKYDVGVRASILSFKPTLSTDLAVLESLATSIVTAGHPCDVIVYHEPVDDMPGPDFIALYKRSCAPFRDAGVPVGVCYTNYSANLPYSDSKNPLRYYWPGEEFVDFLAIDKYTVGEITATLDAAPIDEQTRRVAQFADARGVQLGLAEYAVDGSQDVTKNDRWMRSVADWAFDRIATGRPLRWMSYFSAATGGNYWLENKAEYVDAYVDSYRIMEA